MLPARAPLLEPVLGMSIPDNELTSHARCQAAQGLARRPAGAVPARAGGRGAARARARGLPLDRPAVARPARGARRGRRASLPVLFVLNYRPRCRARRRPRPRAAAPVRGDRAERARDCGRRAADPLQARAAVRRETRTSRRRSWSSSRRDRRATRSTSRSCSTTSRRRASTCRTRLRCATCRLPESLHSLDPEPHRHARRVAAPDAQGGQRGRPRRSSRRAARASIRSSAPPTTSGRDLGTLRAVDLVTLDREADEAYLFKHVVTQEVTYESLPFATRAMLHERVGGYIEEREADTIERQLDLLAHHYWLSDNAAKKREYLVRAGEAAQASYANAAAIDYFERAAPPGCGARARRRALEARQGARAGRRLAARAGGEPRGARPRRSARRRRSPGLVRDGARRGRAPAGALRRGGRRGSTGAPTPSTASDDDAGLGQRAAPRRHARGASGATTTGRSRGTRRASRSASASATRPAWPACSRNLGVVAEYRGDYEQSPRATTSGRSRCRQEIGDRWAIAVSMTNLGTIAVHQHDVRRGADAVRGGDAAQPRGRRRVDGGDQPQQPRQRRRAGSATTRRPAVTTRRASARTATTTTRWAMAFLLEDIGAARRHARRARAGASSSSAPPTRCARRSALRGLRRSSSSSRPSWPTAPRSSAPRVARHPAAGAARSSAVVAFELALAFARPTLDDALGGREIAPARAVPEGGARGRGGSGTGGVGRTTQRGGGVRPRRDHVGSGGIGGLPCRRWDDHDGARRGDGGAHSAGPRHDHHDRPRGRHVRLRVVARRRTSAPTTTSTPTEAPARAACHTAPPHMGCCASTSPPFLTGSVISDARIVTTTRAGYAQDGVREPPRHLPPRRQLDRDGRQLGQLGPTTGPRALWPTTPSCRRRWLWVRRSCSGTRAAPTSPAIRPRFSRPTTWTSRRRSRRRRPT